MNIELTENKGGFDVVIDEINLGSFEAIDKGNYSYFPRRNDLITGTHLMIIGRELNKINKLSGMVK